MNRAADVGCRIERTSLGDGDEEGVGEAVNSTPIERMGRESGGRVDAWCRGSSLVMRKGLRYFSGLVESALVLLLHSGPLLH